MLGIASYSELSISKKYNAVNEINKQIETELCENDLDLKLTQNAAYSQKLIYLAT